VYWDCAESFADVKKGEGIGEMERKCNTALTTGKKWTWKQLKMLSTLFELLALFIETNYAKDKKSIKADAEDKIKSLIPEVVKPETRELLQSYLLTLMCGRTSSSTRCKTDQLIAMLWSTSLQLGDGETSVRQLVRALKDGMFGRRFSVLEEGHFVAAPEEAEVGDAVFVLIGCSVPVCGEAPLPRSGGLLESAMLMDIWMVRRLVREVRGSSVQGYFF
jgi:hypothetical protein